MNSSKIEEALKRARAGKDSGEATSGDAGKSAPPNLTDLQRGLPSQRAATTGAKPAPPSPNDAIASMAESDSYTAQQFAQRRFIHPNMPDVRVADAFRHLRTSVLQKANHKNFLMLVTGVGEHHGASFVARNLAAAIAFDENKTALLIDCNLQQPLQDELLRGEEKPLGLTDYLSAEEVTVEQIMLRLGMPRLRFIPAGRRVAAVREFFTAPKLKHLFQDLRERYPDRYIIADTAPVTLAADTKILLELVDFGLLVIPYGKATKAQIESSARAIGPEKLIGCVFNNEPVVRPGRRAASG